VITPSLDAADVDIGRPFRLAANRKHAFIGSLLVGTGFILTPEEADNLINRDPRNHDVLFPYINGQDLNQRPDCSPSRWVINFRDWPLDRAEGYPECIDVVRRLVKPERDKLAGGNASANGYARSWWQYGRRAEGLFPAIASLKRVLAVSRVSKTVLPVFLDPSVMASDAVVVFAYEDGGHLALLSSAFHYWWALARSSTMRTDLRYTPSDVFETFPQPVLTSRIGTAGEALEDERQPLMLDRQLGLTALYNQVHSNEVGDPKIARLRELHAEIDSAVAEAFGWDDISLDHGFHETAQGVRFSISEPARREVLKRLLELNHQRHAEEEARGLTGAKGRRRAGREGGAVQTPLFRT
jgi:hypothetical protein